MTFTSDTLISPDGTVIAFRSRGSGPGVIVVPGALGLAADYDRLADALADGFTVHTIERRGRGGSGAQGERYAMARECEDVLALQAATGARYLVGHSYGGLIALQSARNTSAFSKLAVYEPGVSVHGLIPITWVPAFQHHLAAGRPLDALAELSVATGPMPARRMPPRLMKLILLLVMSRKRRRAMYPLLAPTVLEHEEIARLDDATEDYRTLSAPTLLMSGGRSRLPYVPAAIAALQAVLPTSSTHEFAGLDHFGLDRSHPVEVAEVVADYFLAP